MNIYLDFEFTGLHKNKKPISIGMVTEYGDELYAEFNDYNEFQCDDWVKENVIPKLIMNYTDKGCLLSNRGKTVYFKGDKNSIADKIKLWISTLYKEHNEYIQLVSDCCHYDAVLFIDLITKGTTGFGLDTFVSPVFHDINQDIADHYEISDKEAFDKSREEILTDFKRTVDGAKHNSLYDAKVIMEIYKYISVMKFASSQRMRMKTKEN